MASFLFSADSREKFALTDANKSIWCRNDYGPIFGGGNGCDLVIREGEGQSNVSFPCSYSGNGKYKCNQAAWTALCGNPAAKKFTAVEWEVYRVVFP